MAVSLLQKALKLQVARSSECFRKVLHYTCHPVLFCEPKQTLCSLHPCTPLLVAAESSCLSVLIILEKCKCREWKGLKCFW